MSHSILIFTLLAVAAQVHGRPAAYATTPAANEQCIPKLKKELKENDSYFDAVQKQVDQANIFETYNIVVKKAEEICNVEQVNRLKTLLNKYHKLKEDIQALAPEYPLEVRRKVLKWIRNNDTAAIITFIIKESMKSVFDAKKRSKLAKVSLQFTSMEMELIINPI